MQLDEITALANAELQSLASAAAQQALIDDRDSWREQASQRVADAVQFAKERDHYKALYEATQQAPAMLSTFPTLGECWQATEKYSGDQKQREHWLEGVNWLSDYMHKKLEFVLAVESTVISKHAPAAPKEEGS